MIQVVYASQAARPFPLRELKTLLLQSRLRNHADGLSGMLLFHDDFFLQALEGKEDAVMGTLARIEADPRHHRIEMMGGPAPIATRNFGSWSMGFRDVTGRASLLKGFVALRHSFDAGLLDRDSALRILFESALDSSAAA